VFTRTLVHPYVGYMDVGCASVCAVANDLLNIQTGNAATAATNGTSDYNVVT